MANTEKPPAESLTEALADTIPPGVSVGPPRLLGVEGVASRIRHDLAGTLTIGRALHAGLVIEDSGMSRLHARVEACSNDAWVLHDLQSKNGTFVNEERISSRTLAFGDRIRFGGSVFLFTHANPWEAEFARKERLAMLGRLAAGVAHDFNNMTQIMSLTMEQMSSLLQQRGGSDAAIEACFRDMRGALDRAAGLSARLLGTTRVEGRGFARINLSDLCRESLELARRAALASVEFVTSIPSHQHVIGDREQLHQMLLNLCVNACDAMPRGGRLTLSLKAARGEEGTQGRGGSLKLTVSDTGVGMDADTQRRAIEPFFTTKPAGRGTGLGLAMVAETIKYHGGQLDLESAPGRGTTWHITLPAASLHTTGTEIDLKPVRLVTDPLRLLIVDDEPVMVNGLGRLLTARGHRVRTASDGGEAIEAYAAERPDAVVMDLNMPRVDGRKALLALRARDPEARILLISGNWHESYSRELGLEPGGRVGFLLKPFGTPELEAAVGDLLAGRPPIEPRAGTHASGALSVPLGQA